MLRLKEELQSKLVTSIEVLRISLPRTANSSVTDRDDLSRRGSLHESSHAFTGLGEQIDSTSYNRLPLTKESLDLMDTPVPSGVLAEEFAYHGLAPSFLKEMTRARELLDEIYIEIKKYLKRGDR